MKTCCPSCETILSVTPSQLKARGGRVRCGVCHEVFNALDNALDGSVKHLREQRGQRDSYRHPGRHDPMYDDHGAQPYDDGHYYDERYDDRLYQDEPFVEGSNYDDDRIVHDYDDDYYQGRRSRARGGLFGVVIVFVLMVALVLQGAVVFRNQLAHYFPSTRFALMQLCSIAKCEVGGTRSIAQFNLDDISLDVRSDVPATNAQTVLILQAKLINKENRPGVWPSLVLSLKDARGQVDRQRIISPNEYLVSELKMQPMAPLSEYQIRLHLSLAGAMATVYELKPYYEE